MAPLGVKVLSALLLVAAVLIFAAAARSAVRRSPVALLAAWPLVGLFSTMARIWFGYGPDDMSGIVVAMLVDGMVLTVLMLGAWHGFCRLAEPPAQPPS